MVQSKKQPLILGTPFLNIASASIDFSNKRVVLKNINDKVFYSIKPSSTKSSGTISYDNEEIESMESSERNDIASTLRVYEEKKASQLEEALGYGNVEEALALDGDCLELLFSIQDKTEKFKAASTLCSIVWNEKREGLVKRDGSRAKKKKPKFKPFEDVMSKSITSNLVT